PLAVAARWRLGERVAVVDDTVLRLAALRAPATARNFQFESGVEGRPVHAGLAARNEAVDHGGLAGWLSPHQAGTWRGTRDRASLNSRVRCWLPAEGCGKRKRHWPTSNTPWRTSSRNADDTELPNGTIRACRSRPSSAASLVST